jgi:GT2 family glycosyltransferase
VETRTDEIVADEPGTVAPPVVAVVVAHDPGDWFEECLRSLGAQDYPSFSVLVVDAGSTAQLTPRVADVLPSAYVRRLESNPGVGAASNEVLEIVEGAAFYLLCHDDVALQPGCVRALVEEAYRSNAGVVGPKLVEWDDPTRLLQVGVLVDKTGHEIATVERGELDQEQHDAVRDVFCVPSAVTLVRADLFASLGGYDPAVTYLGEDLDLCWRAQVAGARVLVAPAAVARHLEALGLREGFGPEVRRRLTLQHRLRAVLTCYGRWHRWRVLPQIALLTVAEVVYAVAAGRRRLASDLVGAWRWNRSHRAEVRAARARVEATRAIPDTEVRRLQARGSARVAAFLRGQLGRGGDDRVRAFTRSAGDVAGSLRRGPLRTAVLVWGAVVLVVLVGSRHHLFDRPPSLVDLPEFPQRPWPVLAEWTSGWRSAGLGSEAPQPTAYGLLGVGGTVLLGSMTLLRRLLVVAPLLLGPIGAGRLAGRVSGGSRHAVLVGAVSYAAIPLPYNALAEGRWGGVLATAAAPWIVSFLGPAVAPGATRTPRIVVGLGLLTAALSAFVPLALALPLVVALALLLGSAIAGDLGGAVHHVGLALAATAVALVLHLPWALDFALPGSNWAPVGGVASSTEAPSVDELLRFETGPWGAAPLGWLPLVAAALPLLIAARERLTWAARAWALAVVGWGLAVLAGSEAVSDGAGPVELLLAPAATGIALAAALGIVAFEADLPGFRFGWRQAASGVAAVALVLATLPVLGAALGGRWDTPSCGVTDVLAFLDAEQETAGAFRTLWLGDPAVLPLAGWELDEGVAWGLTDEGNPTVLDRWPGSVAGATGLAADALHLAETGGTSRLGRLLAPMGVRYLVVVEADRPVAGELVEVRASLPAALGEQLDLAEVEVDDGLHVFRNEAWFAARAQVGSLDQVAIEGTYLRGAARVDLSGVPAVLGEQDGTNRYEGAVDGDVWTSLAAEDGWELRVDGRRASSVEGFGWGRAYAVDAAGDAVLEYRTPLARLVLSAVQAALWAVAVWFVVRTRARRDEEVVA